MGIEAKVEVSHAFDHLSGSINKVRLSGATVALSDYLDWAKESGLIGQVFIVVDPKQGLGEIVSMFKRDISRSDYGLSDFKLLLGVSNVLELKLRPLIDMNVTFLNPSHVGEFLGQRQQKGVVVDAVELG